MYQDSSILLLLSCLSSVFCQIGRPPYTPSPPLPPPPQYPTPSPVQDYNPDTEQTNVGGYGVNKDPYCHMVEKVIFNNKCEPYKVRSGKRLDQLKGLALSQNTSPKAKPWAKSFHSNRFTHHTHIHHTTNPNIIPWGSF